MKCGEGTIPKEMCSDSQRQISFFSFYRALLNTITCSEGRGETELSNSSYQLKEHPEH